MRARNKVSSDYNYSIDDKLASRWSRHLDRPPSAATATTNDCAALNTQSAVATSILLGTSSSSAACSDGKRCSL